MGFYIERENFNRQFAELHALVRHNGVISGSDRRSSFYRINSEEELLTASLHWAHFPALVMVGLSIAFINKSDSIRQVNANSLMFVEKLQIDPDNPGEADAISASYDRTLEIAYDYIGYMQNDLEQNECDSTFKGLEPERIRLEQDGPFGDQLYGWIMTFPDETKAARALTYNPGHFV